jgi:hypothetical protein
METEHGTYMKKSYWLLIGLVVLQSAVLGLVVYAERESSRRDQVIEQRTGVMVDELFPEILRDLSTVSGKASEIGRDVKDLKVQVAAVDDHVSDVGRNVNSVSSQVEGVNKSVTGFFEDKKGLIWGHSLNPYVLIGMLLLIAAGIPLCGWLFGRIRKEREFQRELSADLGHLDGFSLRLDQLHGLLEKIRSTEKPSDAPGPELRKLVEDTERLIAETRAELALISRNPFADPGVGDGNPEVLH